MIQDEFDNCEHADLTNHVLDTIYEERKRQVSLHQNEGSAEEFEREHTRNEWIANVVYYMGRATMCSPRESAHQDFMANMTKAATLCVAAIEAHYKGYC
jgi:hypothetical protein